jgi:hypothetical protein
MDTPPGSLYVLRGLPRLLLLPSVVYIAGTLFQIYYRPHVYLPTWVLPLLAVLSLPVVFTVSVFYTEYTNAKRAAALGAVLPPQVPGKWPGCLSTLRTLIDNFQMGIPGESGSFLSFQN